MLYEDYVKLPGIRWSHLKKMGSSPKHYRHAATGGEEKKTASQSLGIAEHAAVYEPETIIGYLPGKPRHGSAWEKFQDDNPGKLIVTAYLPASKDTIELELALDTPKGQSTPLSVWSISQEAWPAFKAAIRLGRP